MYRTAKKMLELGWLECHERRYSIGTRLFERAMLAGERLALRDAALPILQEVCAVTHETANLAVLDGGEVLYLEKLVGRKPVATPSRVGALEACAGTALGKILTAFAAPEVGEQLIESGLAVRTPNTVTSPSVLRRELARVRGESIGFDREETITGCGASPPRSWRPTAPVSRRCRHGTRGPAGVRPDGAGSQVRRATGVARRHPSPLSCAELMCSLPAKRRRTRKDESDGSPPRWVIGG